MNPQVQNPNDILNAISALGAQLATNLPTPTIPTLNYTAPNVSDLSSQYQQFLTRAANDPDIVNYYNQLLQQAQGDTTIAQNFLEQDYQTGVRNQIANTSAALKNLGLTFTGEQNSLQDTLNKRGIALTDNGQGGNVYAGGGQAATELGNLNQSQQLRQEAEQRSAQQNIQGLSTTLQKGLTSSGQQLTQYAQGLNQQKQGDIANRASTYYGIYQQNEQAKQQQALADQQNKILSGGGSSNKPTAPPVPGNTGAGVNTTQNGYRWTGTEWV